jgi:hypothetical protein
MHRPEFQPAPPPALTAIHYLTLLDFARGSDTDGPHTWAIVQELAAARPDWLLLAAPRLSTSIGAGIASEAGVNAALDYFARQPYSVAPTSTDPEELLANYHRFVATETRLRQLAGPAEFLRICVDMAPFRRRWAPAFTDLELAARAIRA